MEELVEKAKKNDEIAFNELIISIEKEIYLIARTRLKNEEDIADAMQETIISCYKNLKKLRENSFFKTWTIKILINECNKIYKKNQKYNISYEEENIDNYIQNNDTSLEKRRRIWRGDTGGRYTALS